MALDALLLTAAKTLAWSHDGARARVCVIAQLGTEEGLLSIETSERSATDLMASALREAVAHAGARVIWAGLGAIAEGHRTTLPGGAVAVTQVTRRADAPVVHLTSNLSRVRAISEEGVLEIGQQVRNVSQLAKKNTDDLTELATQFDAHASHSVASSIDELARHVRHVRASLAQRIERQAAAVNLATKWTTDILKLGQAITDIAATARMLTFNARVESARIGTEGKGFAVIAQAIQDLAIQIRGTNHTITDLVSKLASALPELQHEAESIARTIVGDAEIIEQHLSKVNEGVNAVQHRSASLVDERARSATVLQERVGAILQAMQFQDRASQLLDEAEEQAHALLAFSGLSQSELDEKQAQQVGRLGRASTGDDLASGGSVILM